MEICEGCGARAEPGVNFEHDVLCQARVPDVVCGQKAGGGAICTNQRPCDEHDIARARHLLQVAVGYANPSGVGDTLIGQAQRAARRVAELGEIVDKVARERNEKQYALEDQYRRHEADRKVLVADCTDAKKRAEAHSASIAKMCDERAMLIQRAEDEAKCAANALSARDAVFLELQAIREATMLDPPDGDWSKITAEHVRQHVQDLADQRDRAMRDSELVARGRATESDGWRRAASAYQLVDITTPEQLAVRIADLLARGREASDKILAVVRTMCEAGFGSKPVEVDVADLVEKFAELERTGREWRVAANAGSLVNVETPDQLRERITVNIRANESFRAEVSNWTNAATAARKELLDTKAELLRCIKERDELADEMARGADPAAVAAGIERLAEVDGGDDEDDDIVPESGDTALREAVVLATAGLVFEWLTGEKPPGTEFDEGWISVLRGRIGTRTLEVRHCKTLPEALDQLIRKWGVGSTAEAWPPAWLLPREKAWTHYPWPYGSHRNYYDRSYRDEVA